mmetsp:Transcript_23062/g.32198  ORF Transcript_23062/g.32198 Transcript_23062/m.32198 type:complete len:357 (-) Transcript_23062:146-1216(-)
MDNMDDEKGEQTFLSTSIGLINNNTSNNNHSNNTNNKSKPMFSLKGETISLRVKPNNNGTGMVTVKVGFDDTVETLKEITRDALGPSARGRYLRLICKGRLLAPDAAKLKEFAVVRDGDVIHAVLAAAGVRGGQQAALARSTTTTSSSSGGVTSSSSTSRRYRGTGVGHLGRAVRPNSDVSDSEDDDEDDIEEGRERLGFDRLRGSGLSRHEITAIRTYFSRSVERYMEQHPEEIDERDDLSQRRSLYEDAWMQVQGPTSEFRLNLNQSAGPLFHHLSSASENFNMRTTIGTDRDFLWGFLLGFFVGFLMLVWVWMPTVPHKQKLGILTGISVQLALSVFHSNDQGGDDELDLEGV